MRNRRRRYRRKNGMPVGKWFLVCCVILALAVTIKTFAPGIKDRVQSAMVPVYERTEQYRNVFMQFGAALSGDHSFTDAFNGVLHLVKRG